MIARKLPLPPPELDDDGPELDGDGIEYPDSDGKPLGETGYHVDATLALKGCLELCFGPATDRFVASNMFLYYEQGNPKANRAPDVMVIKGVGNQQRRSFKTWVEKAVPSTILEAVSRKTFREDTEKKPILYAELGVKEYFLFDPEGKSRLKPRFQGFRLSKGRFVPMKAEPDGGFTSTELHIRLVPEGNYIRVIDLQTGKPTPFIWEYRSVLQDLVHANHQLEEQQRRAEDEKRRAEEEKRRADALVSELERLRKKGNRK